MPSIMSFPTRIVHGRGAIRELPAELKRVGATRLLLVADKGIVQAGLLGSIAPLLEQAGIPFAVFRSQTISEPSRPAVARSRPSGLNAALSAVSLWPRRVRISLPVAGSQSRAVKS